MSAKTRLRIDLRLTKDGEVVYHCTKWVKARIIAESERRKFDHGTCKVWYDLAQDYWNQFEFKTIAELKDNLHTDTEVDLLRELVRSF